MPKERIAGPFVTNEDGSESLQQFEVNVGWQADCDVQVGVVGEAGRSLLWQLYGDKLAGFGTQIGAMVDEARAQRPGVGATAERVGANVLNMMDCLSEFGEQGYSGVWADLDRAGVNRLIKLLRRARDSAFGADA